MPLLAGRHVSVPPHIIRHHTILVPKIQTPSSDPIYGPLSRPLMPSELLPAFTVEQAKVITAIRREVLGKRPDSLEDVEIEVGEEIGPMSLDEWAELKEAAAENLRRANAGYRTELELISALLRTDEDHMPIDGKRAWYLAAQEAILGRVLNAQAKLALLNTAEAESWRVKVWRKDVKFEAVRVRKVDLFASQPRSDSQLPS